jgi:hypothetical protein
MLHRPTVRAAVATLAGAALSACAPEPTALTSAPATSPALAKGQTDTDARAIWSFFPTVADGTPAGLVGDGKTAQGPFAGDGPSVYEGNVCGVHAKIFWDNATGAGSGDATLQPDKHWNNLSKSQKADCGGSPRVVKAALGADHGTVAAWFMNARQVMQLTGEPGTVGYRTFQISTTLAACEFLRYNAEVSGVANPNGQIKITYLGDVVDGRRTWIAESQGAHTAGCYAYKNGSYVWDGVRRPIPFRVQIVERPYGT